MSKYVPMMNKAGKFYIAGAAISLGGALSTDRAAFRLENPTGSNKTISIVKLVVYSSVNQQLQYVLGGALGGTPTTIAPNNLNLMSSLTSDAIAQYGTKGTTGGTQWTNESRVTAENNVEIEFPPLTLVPGMSFAIKGTTGEMQTISVNAYFAEDSI